jgi:SAM-dependent methyltransferase
MCEKGDRGDRSEQIPVWDAIYAHDGDVFPTPHADIPQLAQTLQQRGAHELLDLGCGAGRHLTYFARRGFAATDTPTHSAYFMVGPTRIHATTPERAGYFVGYRLVADLTRRYPLATMASWPLDQAMAILKSALEHARSCPPEPPLTT